MKNGTKTVIVMVLTAILLVASPVLAYIYQATYTVVEEDGNAYEMLGVRTTVDTNNQWMADNGFMNSTANDTRIETLGGLVQPHMVTDDKTFAAIPVPANSQTNLYFTTGNTPQDFNIIPGYDGYVTASDDATLELGDNSTVEQSGWVDTASGDGKILVNKPGAFYTYISATENITSIIEDVAWTQVAPQLGGETSIYSLVTFNDKVYGGTWDDGRLYEWNGVNLWVQVAPKLGAEKSIGALAVFNDKLYGGSGLLTGELYEWNGVNAWVSVAPQLGAETSIKSLAVFNGKLYGGTNPNGKLYEWNGVNLWVEVAPKLGGEGQILSLAVYNDKLYGGTGTGTGELYEWNGVNAWVSVAPQLGAETRIHSLVVYNDKLYGGTGVLTGELYEWNGVNAWVSVAPQLGAETRIESLAVYNGKLYGGTGALTGELYEWNGVNAWVQVAPQLGAEKYIWGLAVCNDKLYGGTGTTTGELYEWDPPASVTASGVSSGESIVTTSANTTHMWIDIDGSTEDIVALGGASVPDKTSDWYFMQNNVIPYSDNTSIEVDGVLELWYRPNDIIAGTNLPDRADVVTNNGTFTWGSNPTGVTVALGGLVSSDQPSPGVTIDDPTPDIMPGVEVTDWYTEPDVGVGGSLLTNPMRPFVTILSDTTTLSELQAWRILGTALVLLVLVGVARAVRGHHIITGIATGAIILGLVVLTIYPMWTLVFMAFAVISGAIAERTPSV